jgi:hypothetical protein
MNMRVSSVFISGLISGLIVPLVASSLLGGDAPPSLANNDATYVELRAAALSGLKVSVQDFELKRDIAKITFRQGDFYFLRPTGGKVTGAVFVGTGEFSLQPSMPVERTSLSRLTKQPSITESFSRMALRFTDGTDQQIRKAAEATEGPVDPRAQSALDDVRKMLKKGRLYTRGNIAAAFLPYNMNGRILLDLKSGFGDLFLAYFEGKQWGDFFFGIDRLGHPVTNPEEVVLANLSDSNLGIWVSERLKDPAGAPLTGDSRLVDLEHYDIQATAKGNDLTAVVDLKFKALRDGTAVLPFDLFPTLRMQKVTDQSGKDLSFVQEDKDEDADFFVILAEPLKAGQPYQLHFEYAGDKALEDSGGGNYTLVARTNWYPSNGFGEDRATYEMTLKCSKNLTMIATGQPVSETKEGDWLVSKWKSDLPLAVAGFNYGKFKKFSATEKNTKYVIETYANRELPSYLRDLQNRAERGEYEMNIGALNTTGIMEKAQSEALVSIGLYSQMYGPLPYGRVALTQQPFLNFGQAWPMLVYMPLPAFLDATYRHELGFDRGGSRLFFRYVAAHEVSHQWWGHIIGWKSYRDQWLSEGLAEFSASLFAQAAYKQKALTEFWREGREDLTEKNREGWRPIDVGGVSMGYRLDTAKSGSAAQGVLYAKGGFIIHMLRMMMWDPKTGDDRFFTMMRDFVKTYFNQNVSTDDFKRVVEKHITREMNMTDDGKMDWFFDEWAHGTALPEYRLTYRLDPAEGGKTKLTIDVSQRNVDANFRMPVPIYLEFGDQMHRLGFARMVGSGSAGEFSVLLPKKPDRVLLNAREDVLCTIAK